MPIYDAAYRPLETRPLRPRAPWWTIATTMMRRTLKRHWIVRNLIFVIPAGFCFFATVVFYGRYMAGARGMDRVLPIPGGVGNIKLDIFNMLGNQFLQAVGMFAVIFVALVGAPLIAEDHRARALSLYFSRPLKRREYVLGKLTTVVVLLSFLLILPPIMMYLVEVVIAPTNIAMDRLPSLLWLLAISAAALVTFSAASLGASALTKRPAQAGALLVGIMIFLPVTAQILAQQLDAPGWLMLSPFEAIRALGRHHLPYPLAIGAPSRMSITHAWLTFPLWSAGCLSLLVWRVRRVEVVE